MGRTRATSSKGGQQKRKVIDKTKTGKIVKHRKQDDAQSRSPSQPALQRLPKQTKQRKVSQNHKKVLSEQTFEQNSDEENLHDVRKVVHDSLGCNNNANVFKQDEATQKAKQNLIDEFEAIDREFKTVTTPRQ